MVRQQRTAPKYLRRVQHGDEGARLRLRANRPVDVQRQPNQERQGTSGRNRLARENQLRVGQRLVRTAAQYVHLPFRQKPSQRLDSPCRHAPGRTGRKDREPSRPVESIDLRRRAEQGAQFAQLLFVRRGDFQGGAEPVVPIQGRVAQENVAARIDHDFLPDRGSARSHYTQGGARHAGRRLGRLFRDLLHHHDHRRKDGAGRFVGLVSGHVDRNVHSASDLGIPDL